MIPLMKLPSLNTDLYRLPAGGDDNPTHNCRLRSSIPWRTYILGEPICLYLYLSLYIHICIYTYIAIPIYLCMYLYTDISIVPALSMPEHAKKETCSLSCDPLRWDHCMQYKKVRGPRKQKRTKHNKHMSCSLYFC